MHTEVICNDFAKQKQNNKKINKFNCNKHYIALEILNNFA